MSEADSVDSGVFRKQGLVRLQFSDQPETFEAERHLERECKVESPLARGSPNAATSKCLLPHLRIRGMKQRRGYMPKRPPQIVAQEGNY
ncbi:hypothetical protein HZH66_006231 [Vespula vulgaris]|uniref:Uncharacterized protein n=1 Tax=Vespula vulgaris TaxID=7454 RepID=A0A834K0X3_VESVU|nr:hypothetical protein HZH66_006231 [Vespula vulgaris]